MEPTSRSTGTGFARGGDEGNDHNKGGDLSSDFYDGPNNDMEKILEVRLQKARRETNEARRLLNEALNVNDDNGRRIIRDDDELERLREERRDRKERILAHRQEDKKDELLIREVQRNLAMCERQDTDIHRQKARCDRQLEEAERHIAECEYRDARYQSLLADTPCQNPTIYRRHFENQIVYEENRIVRETVQIIRELQRKNDEIKRNFEEDKRVCDEMKRIGRAHV